MITEKTLHLHKIIQWSGLHLIWITLWVTAVVLAYHFTDYTWLSIPWLPLSVIGTAVAFYLGFKNNSSYDRMWESRKIWGAIVNSSRAWGTYVKAFVSNQFATEKVSPEALQAVKKRLIYRHIAWLYTLRQQLLIIAPWEHAAQGGHVGKTGMRYRQHFGLGLIDKEVEQVDMQVFLPNGEFERVFKHKNAATQLIDYQSTDLAQIREQGLIEDFRHIELQQILYHFYEHQGKCERIKKFPLPRQYGSMSFVFVGIFIFLLPFGMVGEFAKLGAYGIWMSIPFTALIAWIYVVMELVGDYSENPFQGMANDIPMLSLCRTIEIDLREMLGETDLPPAIESKKGILM